MARYSGGVRSITPSTTDDNWTLSPAASESGKIIEVHWGGEVTTTTAMCTRVARSSGAAGAGTAGNTAKLHPNSPTALIDFFTTYATTQPTLDAGDLFAESWNAHGGVVRWLAAPGEEFVMIGAATPPTISCRNSVGTGASTYGTIWEED
jgi:hypothetical protein